MIFKKFGEGGLVRKVKFVRDCLYCSARLPEENLCLQYYLSRYPILCGTAGCLPYNKGEMFGRDAEFAGVEGNAVLMLCVHSYQTYKLLGYDLFSACGIGNL